MLNRLRVALGSDCSHRRLPGQRVEGRFAVGSERTADIYEKEQAPTVKSDQLALQ